MEAVIIAEVACLGKLTEGYNLLCPSAKVSSLDGLIDLTYDVAFQSCNDSGLILPFISCQGKVVDYIECLSGEAEMLLIAAGSALRPDKER